MHSAKEYVSGILAFSSALEDPGVGAVMNMPVYLGSDEWIHRFPQPSSNDSKICALGTRSLMDSASELIKAEHASTTMSDDASAARRFPEALTAIGSSQISSNADCRDRHRRTFAAGGCGCGTRESVAASHSFVAAPVEGNSNFSSALANVYSYNVTRLRLIGWLSCRCAPHLLAAFPLSVVLRM